MTPPLFPYEVVVRHTVLTVVQVLRPNAEEAQAYALRVARLQAGQGAQQDFAVADWKVLR